ncbi:hypothetical protein ABW19_dt0200078 [Dactylella cylindrospora]|nr:hypothetical protein ABW19_dt0200078 [Dactylella cylindrospora]
MYLQCIGRYGSLFNCNCNSPIAKLIRILSSRMNMMCFQHNNVAGIIRAVVVTNPTLLRSILPTLEKFNLFFLHDSCGLTAQATETASFICCRFEVEGRGEKGQ